MLARHGISSSLQTDLSSYVVPSIGLPVIPPLQSQQLPMVPMMPHVSCILLFSLLILFRNF